MKRALFTTIRTLLLLIGVVATVMAGIACTSLPREEQVRMASVAPLTAEQEPPGTIFALGSGPFPSGEALLRVYYASVLAHRYPHAKVIVSQPTDGDIENQGVGLLKRELELRGVPSSSIGLVYDAVNTAEEAISASKISDVNSPIVIVSSPTHLPRSVATFRSAGFTQVYAFPTFPGKETKPSAASVFYRYQIWGSLSLEFEILREWIALLSYKMRGRA